MFEVRELLRLGLAGEGFRSVERLSAVDRKRVRRYVHAAVELGLHRDDGVDQLTDEFIGLVVEMVRGHRRDGWGEAWHVLEGASRPAGNVAGRREAHVVKAHEFLERRGVVVPQRTSSAAPGGKAARTTKKRARAPR